MKSTSDQESVEGAQQPESSGRAVAPVIRGAGGKWAPGASGNPKGRPRRGDALAEAIREHISPEMLIAVASNIVRDQSNPASVRLSAAAFIADRGYARPAERHELALAPAQLDDDVDYESLPLDVLEQLDELEAKRRALIAAHTRQDDVIDADAVALGDAPTDSSPSAEYFAEVAR